LQNKKRKFENNANYPLKRTCIFKKISVTLGIRTRANDRYFRVYNFWPREKSFPVSQRIYT